MKNKLIEDNMNLVYFLVKRYYPTYISNEDVIQEGMVGLCKAASTYDEGKSKFSTYASYCIMNQIKKYFASNAKHNHTLSLDYEIKIDDGSPCTMGDTLVGELDINLDDITSIEFYQTLSDEDKEFIDLCRCYTMSEIADMWGVSKQIINQRSRRLKRKWRKFNED